MDDVIRVLNNALKMKRLSHCILFEGHKNSFKQKYAKLLACAIVLESDSLNDLDADILARINQNQYLDVIFIDGDIDSIKKEDIEKIFNQFKLTGLELKSKKVYILNNINNASVKVLNMLLKFMEEPSSQDIYGILISDDSHKLLPTIKSRSFRVLFKKNNQDLLIQEYLDNGFEDADLLVSLGYEYYYFNDLKLYQIAKSLSVDLVNKINNLNAFIFNLYNETFEVLKKFEKEAVLKCLRLFIDLTLNTFKVNNNYQYLDILISAKNKLNNYFDYKLVLDEMLYNLYMEV